LSTILQDLEIASPECDLTGEQQAELNDIIHGCRNTLQDLEKVLQNYRDLGAAPAGFSQKTLKVWKRVKREPGEIAELRARISSNVTLLDAFNEKLTRKNLVTLIQRQDERNVNLSLSGSRHIDSRRSRPS
jgi:hypothetical protein